MAGLYDRMHRDGLDGQGGDRVNVHLISESICAYMGGVFTEAQVISALNADLAFVGSQDLRAADLTDLGDIVSAIDGLPNTTAKIVYVLTVLSPVFMAAERDLITESNWRSALGI